MTKVPLMTKSIDSSVVLVSLARPRLWLKAEAHGGDGDNAWPARATGPRPRAGGAQLGQVEGARPARVGGAGMRRDPDGRRRGSQSADGNHGRRDPGFLKSVFLGSSLLHCQIRFLFILWIINLKMMSTFLNHRYS